MTFKPAIWYPIAVVLSVINLVGVGFAARPVQPWHATIHAALAVAFGLWAQRLRRGPGGSERQVRLDALDGGESSEEVQALRNELETVRRELSELNERVDFAERLLARGRSPDAIEKQVIPRP
ncbi:MAG: hypothetical protein ACREL9_02345 [Gemmatimonadales bacterium]